MSGRKEKLSLGGETAAEIPGRSPVLSNLFSVTPHQQPLQGSPGPELTEKPKGREVGLLAPGRAYEAWPRQPLPITDLFDEL